VFTPRFRNIWT